MKSLAGTCSRSSNHRVFKSGLLSNFIVSTVVACVGTFATLAIPALAEEGSAKNLESKDDVDLDALKKDFAEIKPASVPAGKEESDLEKKRRVLLEQEAELLKALKIEEAPIEPKQAAVARNSKPATKPLQIHTETKAADRTEKHEHVAAAVMAENSNKVDKPQTISVTSMPSTAGGVEIPSKISTDAMLDSLLADTTPAPREVRNESKTATKVSGVSSASASSALDSSYSAFNVQKKANAQLQDELSRSKNRISELLSELQETRNRLVMAEKQVETLSGMIQKRNASALGQLGKGRANESIVRSPADGTILTENRMAAIRSAQPTSNISPAQISRKTGGDMQTAIVTAEKAYLRSGPGKENSPFTSVSKGTQLVVESRLGDWYCVYGPDGNRAWVSKEVLQFVPAGIDASRLTNSRNLPYDSSL